MASDAQARLESFQAHALLAFQEADYTELYGLEYSPDPTNWEPAHGNVLVKFMTANNDDITLAKEQLLKTLKWRKEFKPLNAAKEKHDAAFEDLGVITRAPGGRVITWNLYGYVKNPRELFARHDEFLRWRVGLMERGIQHIDLAAPGDGSTMDQVHDYMNVSFLRMDSETRKTTKEIVQLFQDYYPEFLANKYFVNIPMWMMWVFKVVRMMMATETAEKFHIVNDGKNLKYDLGDWLPKAYGGTGPKLQDMSIEKPRKPETTTEADPVESVERGATRTTTATTVTTGDAGDEKETAA